MLYQRYRLRLKNCGTSLMEPLRLSVNCVEHFVFSVLVHRKLATEPVIGWERHDWTISDDNVGKSSVDPLLLQIHGVERMINTSSFRSSRVLCRIQKAKLNIVYYLREAYYSPIMPVIGR